MLGKNCVGKSAKNVFYIDTKVVTKKIGEKKSAKQFFQKHELCDQKMLVKKSSEKVPKNVFYIHTIIITKKWGQKTRETIFSEAHE